MQNKKLVVTATIAQFIKSGKETGHIWMSEEIEREFLDFMETMLKKEVRDLEMSFWTGRTDGVDYEMQFKTYFEESYCRPRLPIRL